MQHALMTQRCQANGAFAGLGPSSLLRGELALHIGKITHRTDVNAKEVHCRKEVLNSWANHWVARRALRFTSAHFGRRVNPCSIQGTDDNQCPAMATEPRELRSGQRKPGGGRGGSDHGCHGRGESVLAGGRTKNVEHRFGGGGASSVRGRGGEDCAQAVFVDREKIQ